MAWEQDSATRQPLVRADGNNEAAAALMAEASDLFMFIVFYIVLFC